MKPAPASASLGNRKINVLLVGGGGREHALAWKLKQSSSLGALFTTHPENPGLAKLCRPCDVPLDPREIVRLKAFCDREKIGLVVIGPEHYLAQGMADALASPTTVVFGPGKEAAQLETDKWWAKELMRGASIPTAEARVFRDAENAKSYLISRTQPLVIKASGLAGGKGVVVGQTVKECIEAVDRMMVRREFGDAGSTIIAEERLEGREVSVFALVDGRNVVILDPCQDHKRLLDNDEGPNTGGMGAFCPSNALDARTMAIVQREIIVPTIDALRRDTIDFRGVLYVGLMLTPAGPKVLEYNVRFGDPECQCLVRRIEGDWVKLLLATAGGQLDRVEFESSSEDR